MHDEFHGAVDCPDERDYLPDANADERHRAVTQNPQAEFELYVIQGLIERLAKAFNTGGTELVRADIKNLAHALRHSTREPAAWAIDAWLAEQVQRY